jgi:hypothetical protein
MYCVFRQHVQGDAPTTDPNEVKLGPITGRPKKIVEEEDDEEEEVEEEECTVTRRGRGRPKKIVEEEEDKKDEEVVVVEEEEEECTVTRRDRGRPKKGVKQVEKEGLPDDPASRDVRNFVEEMNSLCKYRVCTVCALESGVGMMHDVPSDADQFLAPISVNNSLISL